VGVVLSSYIPVVFGKEDDIMTPANKTQRKLKKLRTYGTDFSGKEKILLQQK
jgi:hypothetical protein